MWLFTVRGFFSVVADNQHEGRMLIRARCRQDALNLYNDHHEVLSSMTKPASDESGDYRYWIGLDKKDWIKLAARLAEAVDYSNFKSAVHDQPSQSNKSMAYLRIWQTMMDVQRADRDAEDDDRLGHDDDSIPWKDYEWLRQRLSWKSGINAVAS
jgi:hypothetical protein